MHGPRHLMPAPGPVQTTHTDLIHPTGASTSLSRLALARIGPLVRALRSSRSTSRWSITLALAHGAGVGIGWQLFSVVFATPSQFWSMGQSALLVQSTRHSVRVAMLVHSVPSGQLAFGPGTPTAHTHGWLMTQAGPFDPPPPPQPERPANSKTIIATAVFIDYRLGSF